MKTLILLVALLCPPALYAQDTAPVAVAASAPSVHMATPTVEHKATPTVEHKAAPEATNEEVLAAAFKTVEEAQKYFKDRESSTKKAFVWALMVAALLKLLISLIRRTSSFWKKTKGKWVIRLITLTLGAAAGILANVGLGMPWWDAVTIFFGGPGAVLLTEYQKMIPFLTPKKE